jgi:hypothetical protein
MTLEERVAAMEHELRRLKDRQDILDCIVRESRGRDRHDSAMIASCFWEEGWDEHGPSITLAPDYPANANAGHAAGFSANSHNLTNHSCEIDGDTAYCETYVLGGLLSPDEQTCKIAAGRYADQLERRGGEWRILHRRTIIDMVAEGDASWLHSPAIAGFLRGVRSRADPSYQRPIELKADDARW